uniref:NADH-ubiquinone oxidoreductase chain 2 n=1 Tax=Macrocheles nataliae TaxID=2058476 RepID=A0A6B9WFU9_9ACAR|nr:NADH dehydrogenase subunit 2 [Macrocheles nataliae]
MFFMSWIFILSILLNIYSFNMTFSSMNWFSLWFSLEINMISFIPLMFNKNYSSSTSMMKYFIIQVIASNIIMFSFMFSNKNFLFEIQNLFLMFSLLMKMGASPFHFWFPQISISISWMPSFFLLCTTQKLIPLYIMNNLYLNSYFLLFCYMNMFFGSLMIFFQSSMKKIIAYSSISHISWILSIILMNNNWLFYWIMYSCILLSGMTSFQMFNIKSINQMLFMEKMMSVFFIIFFLSMSGIPPLTGFLMKIFVLDLINNNIILSLFLIFSSFMNSFFYLRSCYMIFIKNFKKKKLINNNNFMLFNLMMILMMPFIFF